MIAIDLAIFIGIWSIFGYRGPAFRLRTPRWAAEPETTFPWWTRRFAAQAPIHPTGVVHLGTADIRMGWRVPWVCTCGQRNIVSGLPCLACDRPSPAPDEVVEAAPAKPYGTRFKTPIIDDDEDDEVEAPAEGGRFRPAAVSQPPNAPEGRFSARREPVFGPGSTGNSSALERPASAPTPAPAPAYERTPPVIPTRRFRFSVDEPVAEAPSEPEPQTPVDEDLLPVEVATSLEQQVAPDAPADEAAVASNVEAIDETVDPVEFGVQDLVERDRANVNDTTLDEAVQSGPSWPEFDRRANDRRSTDRRAAPSWSLPSDIAPASVDEVAEVAAELDENHNGEPPMPILDSEIDSNEQVETETIAAEVLGDFRAGDSEDVNGTTENVAEVATLDDSVVEPIPDWNAAPQAPVITSPTPEESLVANSETDAEATAPEPWPSVQAALADEAVAAASESSDTAPAHVENDDDAAWLQFTQAPAPAPAPVAPVAGNGPGTSSIDDIGDEPWPSEAFEWPTPEVLHQVAAVPAFESTIAEPSSEDAPAEDESSAEDQSWPNTDTSMHDFFAQAWGGEAETPFTNSPGTQAVQPDVFEVPEALTPESTEGAESTAPDFNEIFPSPWTSATPTPVVEADDSWFPSAVTLPEPAGPAEPDWTPAVAEPAATNGPDTWADWGIAPDAGASDEHNVHAQPDVPEWAPEWPADDSYGAPGYEPEAGHQDFAGFVPDDAFDDAPFGFHESPAPGTTGLSALAGRSETSEQWWSEGWEQNGVEQHDAGAYEDFEDEEDGYEYPEASGQPKTMGDVSNLFAQHADLDEPDEYELDDDEWAPGDSGRAGGRIASREPAGRGSKGAGKRPNGKQGRKSFKPSLSNASVGRPKFLVVILVVVAIAAALFFAKDVFARVAAAPDPNAAHSSATCDAGQKNSGVKNAAALQSLLAAAPSDWKAEPDYSAGTGAIDFSKALQAEPNPDGALSTLDQSRFRFGYDRSYAGPNNLKASSTVYEFGQVGCTASYLRLHGAAVVATASFAVPSITGATGAVVTANGAPTYVVVFAHGTQVFRVTWSGDPSAANAQAGVTALAQAQLAVVAPSSAHK